MPDEVVIKFPPPEKPGPADLMGRTVVVYPSGREVETKIYGDGRVVETVLSEGS